MFTKMLKYLKCDYCNHSNQCINVLLLKGVTLNDKTSVAQTVNNTIKDKKKLNVH